MKPISKQDLKSILILMRVEGITGYPCTIHDARKLIDDNIKKDKKYIENTVKSILRSAHYQTGRDRFNRFSELYMEMSK